MPIVIDPPVSPPLTPPAEDGSYVWELLYGSLGFHRDDDGAYDFALRKFCEAWAAPLQLPYDLVRERDNAKAWTILFDPDRCPAKCLPYLAQYVGITIVPEMSELQLRAEIKQPTGWRRGQPESLRIATFRTLRPVEPDEALRVIIRPRTPEPGVHQVHTWLSQTPDPARTEALLRKALPAWEVLQYAAVTGMTYADVKAEEADYAAVKADFTSYKDLVESLP